MGGFFKLLFLKIVKIKKNPENKKPRMGVSRPQTNSSLHETLVWVPSSGMPSMIGTSSRISTLVAQKEKRAPSASQSAVPRKKGIPVKKNLSITKFKPEDGPVDVLFSICPPIHGYKPGWWIDWHAPEGTVRLVNPPRYPGGGSHRNVSTYEE